MNDTDYNAFRAELMLRAALATTGGRGLGLKTPEQLIREVAPLVDAVLAECGVERSE